MYNIVANSQPACTVTEVKTTDCYTHGKHSNFWSGTLTETNNGMVVTATFTYLLRRLKERQMPIHKSTLEFLLSECTESELIPQDLERDWHIVAMEAINEAAKIYKMDKVCVGETFFVITCPSIKKSRKIARLLANCFTIDRRRKDILVTEPTQKGTN